MISRNPNSQANNERPQSTALVIRLGSTRVVALMLAAFAMLATVYAALVGGGAVAFNSGTWVVGEDIAIRGWLGYLLSAIVHGAASVGLWRQWRWARWVAVIVLAVGLLPAVPGISAAVVDLRVGGIALWGTLIVLRTAALYVLMSTD